MVGFPFLYFGVCYGMEFKQECFGSRAKCKVVPYKKKKKSYWNILLEFLWRTMGKARMANIALFQKS